MASAWLASTRAVRVRGRSTLILLKTFVADSQESSPFGGSSYGSAGSSTGYQSDDLPMGASDDYDNVMQPQYLYNDAKPRQTAPLVDDDDDDDDDDGSDDE